MHVLRFAVGDSAFDRGMRLLFTRWRFQSFTLEDFVATLTQGTGQDLDWWREEWLNRRGIPDLTYHVATTVDSGGYRIHLSVRQTGNLYHLPIDVGVESAGATRLERVQLNDWAGDYSFWSASQPTRVVLDPNQWLLARIAGNE